MIMEVWVLCCIIFKVVRIGDTLYFYEHTRTKER